MRRGSYILGLAFAGVLVLACSPASAQFYSQQYDSRYDSRYDSGPQIDVGLFYDDLEPYGEWIEMPDYGWGWSPRVEREWRPYTRGQWIMTDDGWFWDSEERFGWATYHYGRWINDPYYGWIWIPGTEWAPAWVSWRHGNGYTGWAPLPPSVGWRTRIGLSLGGLDIDAFIGADDYAFVSDRSFVDRGVYQRILPPTRNVAFLRETSNVTHYTYLNNRIVNGGIPVAAVERAVGRRVVHARTVDVRRADASSGARAGAVAVFRPEVRVAPGKRPAQGRSLVKGEQPPPRLAERRRVREQERQKRDAPELTAKDVQQQMERQRAQRASDTKARSDARARDAQQAREQQRGRRQQMDQQRAKQASDTEARSDARARDARQTRERQQSDRQQMDRQRAKQASDTEAQSDERARDAQQAREQQRGRQRQMDQQRAKQASDAKVRSDERARDVQQAREQKPSEQQQMDQQRAQRAANAQARKDKRAKGARQPARDAKGTGKQER